jgi:hypothetical protein
MRNSRVCKELQEGQEHKIRGRKTIVAPGWPRASRRGMEHALSEDASTDRSSRGQPNGAHLSPPCPVLRNLKLRGRVRAASVR